MRLTRNIFLFLSFAFAIVISLVAGGCAQIGMPDGGPKDTLAPKLIRATPENLSRNVTTNKITLEFNEYIDVQNLQQNLIISPLQNRNPTVIANPRSITLKFRDTLLPNTTYTVHFGDAIKDNNEGNVYRGLSYVFSTGNTIDSLSLSGKVILAETGGTDTTVIVMIYRNAADTTVLKKKPNYIAKVESDGSFLFSNLPPASFKIYALKDGDGGKTYNSKSEIFAFADEEASTENNNPVTLYAYAEQKPPENKITSPLRPGADKKLRYTASLLEKQDLFEPLEIVFNNPLKEKDSTKIYLTDTLFSKINGVRFSTDSTAKKIFLTTAWQADKPLILIIEKGAVKDSAGNTLAKTDTLRFNTKGREEYGKLTLRFNDLDLSGNPVLQFLTGNEIKYSYALTGKEWTSNMFLPGQYGIRILYDSDKNGKWTPGNYEKKLQPEIAVTLPQKLNVRADWDNESEINL